MGCQPTPCIVCNTPTRKCQLTKGVCPSCVAKQKAAEQQAQNANTTNPPQG